MNSAGQHSSAQSMSTSAVKVFQFPYIDGQRQCYSLPHSCHSFVGASSARRVSPCCWIFSFASTYIYIYMENLGPTLLRCFVCDKCSHTQSTLMMRSVLALAQYYAHLSILLNQLFNIDAHYHSLPGQRCVDISDGLQDTCVLAAFRCRSDGCRLKKELSRIRSSIVRWDEKVSPPRAVFQGL